MAAFLLLEGLTGALLAFRGPIEHALAPELYAPVQSAPPLSLGALAQLAEARDPHARVGYFWYEPARAVMRMMPRTDPSSGKPYALDFDHVFLDPWTGRELGRRLDGALSQGRRNWMPFIFRLHLDLTLGTTGQLVLGTVALAWTLDCLVSVWLTLPAAWGPTLARFLIRWKPAWKIKGSASAIRVHFDLHRACGLWFWPLLLVFAWSSVMFELPAVYEPVTRALLDYPSVEQLMAARARAVPDPAVPRLSWQEAEQRGAALMAAQAAEHGFRVLAPYGMAYIEPIGVYTYAVASSLDIERGWATSLWLDAVTGEFVSLDLAQGQHSGATLSEWLRALHFADLRDSLAYRLLVAAVGLIVCVLAVTGIYIWSRKRGSRRWHHRHHVRAAL